MDRFSQNHVGEEGSGWKETPGINSTNFSLPGGNFFHSSQSFFQKVPKRNLFIVDSPLPAISSFSQSQSTNLPADFITPEDRCLLPSISAICPQPSPRPSAFSAAATFHNSSFGSAPQPNFIFLSPRSLPISQSSQQSYSIASAPGTSSAASAAPSSSISAFTSKFASSNPTPTPQNFRRPAKDAECVFHKFQLDSKLIARADNVKIVEEKKGFFFFLQRKCFY